MVSKNHYKAISFCVFVILLGGCALTAAHRVEETDQADDTLTLGLPSNTGQTGSNNIVEASSASSEQDDDGEWRQLGKDEAVPVGSHVRLDMTTGERTIKMESAKRDITTEAGPEFGDLEKLEKATLSAEEREHLAVQEMEKILYGLPEPEPMLSNLDKSKLTPAEYEAALKKIWDARQAMLKEVMDSIQNEAEEMKRHLASLMADNATETSMLWDLENLHSLILTIDNSQDFVTLGGLEVCDLLLENDQSEIRTAVAHLVGAVVRHLPHLQEAASRLRILELLVTNLSNAMTRYLDPADETEAASRECAKVVYALGSLLRGSQAAQQVAIEKHNVMEHLKAALLAPPTSAGLRNKIVALSSDLLQETYCESAAANQQADIVVIPNTDSDDPEAAVNDRSNEDKCMDSPARSSVEWGAWCEGVASQIRKATEQMVEPLAEADDGLEDRGARDRRIAMNLLRNLLDLKEHIAPFCSSSDLGLIESEAHSASGVIEGSLENLRTWLGEEQLDDLLSRFRRSTCSFEGENAD